MVTRRQWLRETETLLLQAGIKEARTDARFLLKASLNLSDTDLMVRSETVLDNDQSDRLDQALSRRVNREPLSHILGTQPFWTLEMKVTPDVLTPRADTETVVEAVLNSISDRQSDLQILDIGTGSGAILLALISELAQAQGIGTDKSAPALEVACQNAVLHNLSDSVRFIETDWAEGIMGPFDIIVSNPPYIASDVIHTLDPEVKDHEPHLALDGGRDGLDAYRILLDAVPDMLKSGGLVAFEIGYDQGHTVLEMARDVGLTGVECIKDLAGQDRCIRAHKS